MDANTAHPRLIISDDMKSVRHNLCIGTGFRSCGRLCMSELCLCRFGVAINTSCCQTTRSALIGSPVCWAERWSHLGNTTGRWDALHIKTFLQQDCQPVTVGILYGELFLIRWMLLGRRTGIWAWPENRSTGRGRSLLPRATDTGSSALETSKLFLFPEVSSLFNLMFMIISRKLQPYDSWLAISFLMFCWLYLFFCLLRNKYAFYTLHSSDVQLNLQPRKIGIFVDFEHGQVHCGNFFSLCKAMSGFLYQFCLGVPPGLILQR